MDLLIDDKKTKKRSLIEAMIIARIINPASKLATARGLDSETCNSSISQVLGIENVGANELYESLDYLLSRQEKIESKLAEKHLVNGSLILYDVTSTYVEGDHCSLAKYGYNREKKKGKAQIIFGLICDKYGCPIAVEVFEGNVVDSQTLSKQIEKVEEQLNFVRSENGKEKDRKKRNKDNDAVDSFRTLLEDLGTITLNKIRINLDGEKLGFEKVTKPTLLQEKILKLLGVYLYCTQ